MSESRNKKNKTKHQETEVKFYDAEDQPVVMETTEDIYDFLDNFADTMTSNSNRPAGGVPTPVYQDASLKAVITEEEDHATILGRYAAISHPNVKIYRYTASIDSMAIVKSAGIDKEIKEKGFIIIMPQANTCFCTHCLGTISSNEEEIDKHIKHCYAKQFSPEYCYICNAKNTEESAMAHYTSKTHEKRVALFKSLIRNNHCYHVATNGVSTDPNSSVAKSINGFKVNPRAVDKMNKIIASENRYNKTDEDKLHELIEQMAANKNKSTDLVGKDLTQRNECIKMFHSLLATINIGFIPCYYPREKGDFIHPSVLLDAVKKSAIKKIAKSEAARNNPEKVIAMEKLFTPTIYKDDKGNIIQQQCRICGTKHHISMYDERQKDIIFKMIDGVMKSI